jgi:hypothetical protein
MARHEDIVNTIWDDLDHLSDDGFMLYVWSFTNTKCGMAGIYPVTRRKLVEGRFDDVRLTTALAELKEDDKLFYVDGVLWNKARVSRLSGYDKRKISETIAKSIAKDLRAISPANSLHGRFIERYGSHPNLEGHLSLSIPPGGGLSTESQSQIGRGSPGGHQTPPCQGTGQGQGKDVVSVPDHVSPHLQELDHVAHDRGLTLNVASTVKACEEFGTCDLARESKRFRHFYIDGDGENRRMKDVAGAWRSWLENAPAARASRKSGPKPKATKGRSPYARVEPAETAA